MRQTKKCPQCTKILHQIDKYFPFCSERCKLLDLGGWVDEKYCVPAYDQDEIPTEDDDPFSDKTKH